MSAHCSETAIVGSDGALLEAPRGDQTLFQLTEGRAAEVQEALEATASTHCSSVTGADSQDPAGSWLSFHVLVLVARGNQASKPRPNSTPHPDV